MAKKKIKKKSTDTKDAVILFADVIGCADVSNNLCIDQYDDFICEFHETAINALKHVFGENVFNKDNHNLEIGIKGDEVCLILRTSTDVEDVAQDEELKGHMQKVLMFALFLKSYWPFSNHNRERIQNTQHPRELAIGIHTGKVAYKVHPFQEAKGVKQETSEGYSINFTKRVESESRQGDYYKIFLSEEAKYLTEVSGFPCSFYGEHHKCTPKGFGNPVYLYEINYFDTSGIDGEDGEAEERLLSIWKRWNPYKKGEEQLEERLENQYLNHAKAHNDELLHLCLALTYLSYGNNELRKGYAKKNPIDFLYACEKYNKAISIKNDYHEAYFNWGVTLNQLGNLYDDNPNEAEKCYLLANEKYEKATIINVNYYKAFNNWGTIYSRLGELSKRKKQPKEAIMYHYKAIRKYKKAIEIKGNRCNPFNNWGNALGSLGYLYKNKKPEKAKEYFKQAVSKYKKAIEINENYDKAWYNWGITLDDLGDLYSNEDSKKATKYIVEAEDKKERAEDIRRANVKKKHGLFLLSIIQSFSPWILDDN